MFDGKNQEKWNFILYNCRIILTQNLATLQKTLKIMFVFKCNSCQNMLIYWILAKTFFRGIKWIKLTFYYQRNRFENRLTRILKNVISIFPSMIAGSNASPLRGAASPENRQRRCKEQRIAGLRCTDAEAGDKVVIQQPGLSHISALSAYLNLSGGMLFLQCELPVIAPHSLAQALKRPHQIHNQVSAG